MREIKFRAWMKNVPENWNGGACDGKMYFSVDEEGVYGDSIWDFFAALHFEKERTPDFDYHLMQYTGLKDKNGKEIYEGDLIDTGNECYGRATEVVFGKIGYDGSWNGLTGFALKSWHYDDDRYDLIYHFDPAEDLEVIGNIYENGDLLNE